MFRIDKDGMVRSALIEARRYTSLERGDMPVVNGIVVHQTGGSTARSTFNSYVNSTVGAHFLIEKDRAIYQTASLYKRANHVGLLRSRCLERHRCQPAELKRLQSATLRQRSTMEHGKAFPDRFPSNRDSIGIDAGRRVQPQPGVRQGARRRRVPVRPVTDGQNAALRWLVGELRRTLSVAAEEVYRHPQVSYKTPTEAATASW